MWAGSVATPEAYAIPGVAEVAGAGYTAGGVASIGGGLVQGIAGFVLYEETGDPALLENSAAGAVLDRSVFFLTGRHMGLTLLMGRCVGRNMSVDRRHVLRGKVNRMFQVE